MTSSTHRWLGGLIASAMSGLSGVIGSITADMLTSGSWSWKRCAILGLVAAGAHVVGFLQKSPLPDVDGGENQNPSA